LLIYQNKKLKTPALKISFILILSLVCSVTIAQGFIVVTKSNGKQKKKYYEGEIISIRNFDNKLLTGILTNVRPDSIYIDDFGLAVTEVNGIYKRPYSRNQFGKFLKQNAGWIIAGTALTILGLKLSNVPTNEAVSTSLTIGFGPLIFNESLQHIEGTKSRYYNFKGRFKLKTVDLKFY
jgi:hypothetical protein